MTSRSPTCTSSTGTSSIMSPRARCAMRGARASSASNDCDARPIAYASSASPPDCMRTMTAPAKYWPSKNAVMIASMATMSAAKRPRSIPRSVWKTSGLPPRIRVARKMVSERTSNPATRPAAAMTATGRRARARTRLKSSIRSSCRDRRMHPDRLSPFRLRHRHHEHRARQIVEQILRHAADEQAIDPALSVRAHHDDVRTPCRRLAHDRIERDAFANDLALLDERNEGPDVALNNLARPIPWQLRDGGRRIDYVQRVERAAQEPCERDRLASGRHGGVRWIDRDHYAWADAQLASRDEQRDRETTDYFLHGTSAEPAAQLGVMFPAEHEQRGVSLCDHRFEHVSRGTGAHHHRVHDGGRHEILERYTQLGARAGQRSQLQRFRHHPAPCPPERRAHIVGRVHQPARHISCPSQRSGNAARGTPTGATRGEVGSWLMRRSVTLPSSTRCAHPLPCEPTTSTSACQSVASRSNVSTTIPCRTNFSTPPVFTSGHTSRSKVCCASA